MRPRAPGQTPADHEPQRARQQARAYLPRARRLGTDRVLTVNSAAGLAQQLVATARVAFEGLRDDADERDRRADQVSDRRLAAIDVEPVRPLLAQFQRGD